MSKSRMNSVSRCFPVVAVLALCCACGGGGGGGGGVIPADLCITLAPSAAPAPGTVVVQNAAASTCTLALVDLVATDVNDVFGLSTTVEYDVASLFFVDVITPGSVLAGDGAQLIVIAQEGPLGTVTIGVSRNASTAIDVTGSGVVATLRFIPLNLGTADLSVSTPCLTENGTPPVLKAGVACSGGMTAVIVEP
jgi:hypothetical protein